MEREKEKLYVCVCGKKKKCGIKTIKYVSRAGWFGYEQCGCRPNGNPEIKQETLKRTNEGETKSER